ncbi:MAG: ASCH domain-containing protein [Bacteroidetes bacterium]|nr:ASCH domain-containing protein [Bacteroidota bacterium]
MKAISLIQPWAVLCCLGIKTLETRSWSTKYRGQLLIHASGRLTPESQALMISREFTPFSEILPDSMATGAIIGKVNLREVIKAKDFLKSPPTWWDGELRHERILGDLSGERYVWLLDSPVLFDHAIPCRGRLSIWDYKPQVVCTSTYPTTP